MGLKFARIATAAAATLLVVGAVAPPAFAATWTGPEQITTAAGDIAPGQLLTTATGSVLPYLVDGSSALLSSVYYRRHTLSGFQAPQLLASDALNVEVDFPAWTADDNTVRSLITVGPGATETLRYVQDTNGTLVQQDLGTGRGPALATDPAGSSMAVYAGAQGLLSRAISSAGVASPAVVVDPSTDRPDGVAALGNGEFLAVFSGRNVGTEHPRYAVYSSGAWSTSADVPDTSANYIYGTLQGTPDGRVVLLNSDSVQNGSFSHVYEAGQWGPSVTVTTATGGNSGPAVTPNGTTYVVADQLYSLAPHATSWVVSGPASPTGGSSFCQGDGAGGMGFDSATSTLRVMHVPAGATNNSCNLVDFSFQVPLATAPGAPTSVNAAPGDGQAVVSWTAPASDGGSAITGYSVTPSPACSACTGLTTSGVSSTVAGLTNGTAYTFTVTATNAIGTSAASAASGPVTPVAPSGGGGGTVNAGGTFASDPAGTVPTASNPVVVSITSPAAGWVSIVKGSTSPTLTGYRTLGINTQISAPLATAAQPLKLTFQVYVGALPAGAYPGDVTVFRDSTPIPACPGASTASPDPCVANSSTAGGVETFTVLSSHASSWDFETANVGRLAGADRFGTAAAVSQAQFPGGHAAAVVLARGDDYPDALVAAPLAAAKKAPLLLTVGSSLPTVSKAELQRVLPTGGTVYILGGTSAVPASVASQLTDLGYKVVRYGGADRFATAVQVADTLGDPGTVLLATGTNFPDALSAGVAAAKAGGVVLLTNGTSLPSTTSSYLSAHARTVYAVGGPAAAADSHATALVGADRYATSVAVAAKFFSSPSSVGVASGTAFPDALSGGALLAHAGVPLVLAAPGSLPPGVGAYLSGVKSSVASAHLFGGSAALGAAVQTAVASTLGL